MSFYGRGHEHSCSGCGPTRSDWTYTVSLQKLPFRSACGQQQWTWSLLPKQMVGKPRDKRPCFLSTFMGLLLAHSPQLCLVCFLIFFSFILWSSFLLGPFLLQICMVRCYLALETFRNLWSSSIHEEHYLAHKLHVWLNLHTMQITT